LLSPELAAGISRVKGVKQLGFRSGNWLTAEQCSQVLKHAGGGNLRAKRDYAMLAMLFGCGLRRSELVGLQVDDVQMRQGHWAIVDLIGRQGRPYPHRTDSRLGQSRARRLGRSGRNHRGPDLSGDRQSGESMGQRRLAKCRVVCGNPKYEYRSSTLTFVFGTLLHEGCLAEQDLRGVREDKLDAIRSDADFLAKVDVEEGKEFSSAGLFNGSVCDQSNAAGNPPAGLEAHSG
jgi:integrase